MWLILTVCLAAAEPMGRARAGECRTEALGGFAETQAGPLACLLAGPGIAAEWSATHPKWRVTGWRCGTIDRRA